MIKSSFLAPVRFMGILIPIIIFSALSAAAGISPPTFSKSFNPSTVGVGSSTALTFSITNPNAIPMNDIAFSDLLPVGMVLADPANPVTDCLGATLTAADGGTTITFTDGVLGAGASCTVTVWVTATATGTHTNMTSSITSDAGDNEPVFANLNVLGNRPAVSKSFSPQDIFLTETSTLTLVIDNSQMAAANLFNLFLTDILPNGLQVASPSNATISCVGTITAVAGSNSISLSIGNLTAGAICTASVDVVSTSFGPKFNQTTQLTTHLGTSGFGVGFLDVGPLRPFRKRFTNDPVTPGGIVNLEFTITNLDRDNTATNITFSDDLDAVLSGMVAVGLPLMDVCGPGSQISGTSTITLTSGTLGPGESCTFNLPIQVPAGASPGTYTNTTSSLTSDLGLMSDPAADDLIVSEAPTITMSFLDDPVIAGNNVTLEFSITNNSAMPATGINFTMLTATVLPGMTAIGLPMANICGAGSNISSGLNFTGGSLNGGETCSFPVTFSISPGTPNGTYPFETTNVSGTVNGIIETGNTASDNLMVVAAPRISKSFLTNPVVPGGVATLQFTIEHDENAPADALDISFSDDLEAFLSGAVAVGLPATDVCGLGSMISGTSTVTLVGGSLAPGEICTFTIDVQIPAGASAGLFNNTTGALTATVSGESVTGNMAMDNLEIAGLTLTKSFIDDPVVSGATATLRFTLTNTSSVIALTDIAFTDVLNANLPGLTASGLPLMAVCGPASQIAGTTTLIFTGGSLGPLETCSFDVSVQVPVGAASGEYRNTTSAVTADAGGNPITVSGASDSLFIINPLSISKSFTNDPVLAGGTVNLEFTISNADPNNSITGVTFTDDLNAILPGLQATGLPMADICGAGSQIAGTGVLTFTGGTLAPGGSCTFSVTLQIPGGVPAGSNILNTTSQVTGTLNGNPVNGDPATDTLQVEQLIFSKLFSGDSAPTGLVTLSFTISNPDPINSATGITFTDDLNAVIPGLAAVGLPQNDVCGAGSILSGTSTITLSNGTLGPGETCVINVTVQVPAGAAPGSYLNTTSQIQSTVAGINGASSAASASLGINPPPTFTKSFGSDPIAIGDITTLTFTIDNTASTIAASNLAFTDILPAGLIIATPPNTVSACGGSATAAAGTGTISFSAGSVAAGASCTVSVDVTSTLAGNFVNTTGDLTSTSGSSGTATDSLRVNPPPLFSKSFGADPIFVGGTSTLTFTIDNTASTAAATALAFSDNLPAGLVVATPPNGSSTCGGSLTAIAASGTISFTGGTVPAGASCTISVDVRGTAAGLQANTSGDLTSSLGNSGTASDTIQVNPQPVFSKVFSPDLINVNAVSTLTFTIDNSGSTVPVDSLAFTDNLPASVVIASPANTVVSCTGGTLTAVAGNGTITYSGGMLAAGATCTISVDITSSTPGTHTNTTGNLTSNAGTSNTASDDLTVRAAADLSIAITDNPDPVVAGQTLTYTVVVTNNGPSDADNVVVTTTLDGGLTLVSTSGCGQDPNGVPTCSLGTVAAGGSEQFTITASVGSGVTTTLTSSVAVTSTTFEPNPGDESDSEDTAISLESDLGIVLDGPTITHPGEMVVYTVTVAKAGPSDAIGAMVNATFDATLTGVTWTCSASPGSTCSGSGSGNMADTVDLIAGGTVTYTVTGSVPGTFLGDLDSTASVVEPMGVPDNNPNNNNDSITTTSTSPSDVSGTLGVSLSATRGAQASLTTSEGSTVYFTAILFNDSPYAQFDDPGSDEFTDVLPAGLQLISAALISGGGVLNFDTITGTTIWNGPIPPLGQVVIEIVATIDFGTSGQMLVNQGEIRYDADGDGINEALRLTDDPIIGGNEDPTVIRVISAVPTLPAWGLGIFILLLAVGAILHNRRARNAQST